MDPAAAFAAEASRQDDDLGGVALAIARVEQPRLNQARYLAMLDEMGRAAAMRLRGIAADNHSATIASLNVYVFEDQGFSGNRDRYDDPRNSLLNHVLDRRTGIPITLAVVYLEVARRAGVPVHGINFPGHFLLGYRGDGLDAPIVLDPFDGGAEMSERACEAMLERHGHQGLLDPSMLAPATKDQIVRRLLTNLKRTYIHHLSFPQARSVSDLLLLTDPHSVSERRDRGLLAYHLNDYSQALADLEAYLRMVTPSDGSTDAPKEFQQIWNHVKALRRRIAGFN